MKDVLVAVDTHIDGLMLVADEDTHALVPTSSFEAEIDDIEENGEFADECAIRFSPFEVLFNKSIARRSELCGITTIAFFIN